MNDLPIPELSNAILIGTSTFKHLPNLPAVNNNLNDLAAALTDSATGILPKNRCTKLPSPESTSAFMTRLRSVSQQTEDFLLVYYAGHGVRDQLHDDELYLAVRETDPYGPDGTAIPFRSVRNVIQDSPARTKVLILDCCYSGMAVGAMPAHTVDTREIAVGGTAVITSSPPNKISLSPPGDRHTAFTGELVTLLKQGSRIPNEVLTVRTAFRALRVTLAERQLPQPKLRLTDTDGDILLRRSPPPPPPPPTPPPSPKPPKLTARPEMVVRSSPLLNLSVQPPLEAQASPSVPPAPIKTTQRPPSLIGATSKYFAARCGWLLLWISFIFLVSVGTGALVGNLFGHPANTATNLGVGLGTLIPSLPLGAIIAVHYLRPRIRSKPPRRLADINPSVAARLRSTTTIILALSSVLLLGLTILTFFVRYTPAPNDWGADPVTPHAVMGLLMGLSTIACLYRLYSHLSRIRSKSDPEEGH